ncbi:MAG TPA: hypothetical protein VMJ35_06130 [Dongiaceae bacterium]|nr:hypothetical protein [Dongiaceae bacterium]
MSLSIGRKPAENEEWKRARMAAATETKLRFTPTHPLDASNELPDAARIDLTGHGSSLSFGGRFHISSG